MSTDYQKQLDDALSECMEAMMCSDSNRLTKAKENMDIAKKAFIESNQQPKQRITEKQICEELAENAREEFLDESKQLFKVEVDSVMDQYTIYLRNEMEKMISDYCIQNVCKSQGLLQDGQTESNKISAKFAWLVGCEYKGITVKNTVEYLNLADCVIGQYSFKSRERRMDGGGIFGDPDFSGGIVRHNIGIDFENDSTLKYLNLVGVNCPYLYRLKIPDSVERLVLGGKYLKSLSCPSYRYGGENGNGEDNYGFIEINNAIEFELRDVTDLEMNDLYIPRTLKKFVINGGVNIKFDGMSHGNVSHTLECMELKNLSNIPRGKYDDKLDTSRIQFQYVETHPCLREFVMENCGIKRYSDLPRLPRNIGKIVLKDTSISWADDIFATLKRDYPFCGEIIVNEHRYVNDGQVTVNMWYFGKSGKIYEKFSIPNSGNIDEWRVGIKAMRKRYWDIRYDPVLRENAGNSSYFGANIEWPGRAMSGMDQ